MPLPRTRCPPGSPPTRPCTRTPIRRLDVGGGPMLSATTVDDGLTAYGWLSLPTHTARMWRGSIPARLRAFCAASIDMVITSSSGPATAFSCTGVPPNPPSTHAPLRAPGGGSAHVGSVAHDPYWAIWLEHALPHVQGLVPLVMVQFPSMMIRFSALSRAECSSERLSNLSGCCQKRENPLNAGEAACRMVG